MGLASVLIATRGRPAKAPATPPDDHRERNGAATSVELEGPSGPQAPEPTGPALPPPPPLSVTISETNQALIDRLEAKLAARPDGFDYATYQDLRERYEIAGDKRRVAYYCEVILSHRPHDEVTLNCMGGWTSDGPKMAGLLLEWTEKFPEYRRVAAACRLKAAEVLDDATRAEKLIKEVERMEGVEIEPYRARAQKARATLARKHGPLPPFVVALLADLRKASKTKLADELNARVEQARSRVKTYRQAAQGHTIVGRVVVDGTVDPTQVQAQMMILEDGYFADAVGAPGKPIGFRYHGYEPVDLVPKGEPFAVEDVGIIRLKPLAAANKASIRGRIVLEGREGAAGAGVELQLATAPLNSWTGGYEGERGISSAVSLTPTNGTFLAEGLTPSEHSLYVYAPGYFPEGQRLTPKPGETLDAGVVTLELSHEMSVRYLISNDFRFTGGDPVTQSVTVDQGWRVSDTHRNVYLALHQGKLHITSTYQPFMVSDLGPGNLENFQGIDPRKPPSPPRRDVEPKAGRVYLGHWTYDEHWVLFSIERLEKLTPERARALASGAPGGTGPIPKYPDLKAVQNPKEKIALLEKFLSDSNGRFDWNAHNELRHLYGATSPKRSAYHSDVILRNRFMDDYIVKILGGENGGLAGDQAVARLMASARAYPEYKFVSAACWLRAAELLAADRPGEGRAQRARRDAQREALLGRVVALKGDGLERYRERAGQLLAPTEPARTAPPAAKDVRPGAAIQGEAPDGDPEDATVWPNQISRANSDPWLGDNHDKVRRMRPRVLLVNFSNEHDRGHLTALADRIIAALRESSRHHGHRDERAPPFLDYQVFKLVDLRDADRRVGNSRKFPYKDVRAKSGFNTKYGAFFSDEFAEHYQVVDPRNSERLLNLKELVDGGYVHEVWFFTSGTTAPGDPVDGAFEVVEEKPAYDARFVRQAGRFVQAGNGGDNDQPWTGRSLRIGNVNASRGPGCFLESLAHGVEGTSNSGAVPYFTRYFREFAGFDLDRRYGLPFNSLYAVDYGGTRIQYPKPGTMIVVHRGKTIKVTNYVVTGGNAHFPPNARGHYDLGGTSPVLSTIETWRTGGGVPRPWTAEAFAKYRDVDDCMGPWLVYWRQCMPGLDNVAKDDDGKPMKNWWPFLFY